MKINFTKRQKRQINTCKKNEAFCYDGRWFITIDFYEDIISDFESFFNRHLYCDDVCVYSYNDFMVFDMSYLFSS